MLIYRAPEKFKLRNLLAKFEKKPQKLVTLHDRLSLTPKLTCLFIPSYSTSLRSKNRIRQQALETMPKPKNLESVDEIPEPLKLTHSGDTFLYFDSGKSDSRVLVLQHYQRWICFLSRKSVIAMERFQWHQMSFTNFILFIV